MSLFQDQINELLSRIATALEKRNQIESMRIGLYTHPSQVMHLPKGSMESPKDLATVGALFDDFLDEPLSEVFSTRARAYNSSVLFFCQRNYKKPAYYVRDLLKFDLKELLRMRGCGQKTYNIIREVADKAGYSQKKFD